MRLSFFIAWSIADVVINGLFEVSGKNVALIFLTFLDTMTYSFFRQNGSRPPRNMGLTVR